MKRRHFLKIFKTATLSTGGLLLSVSSSLFASAAARERAVRVVDVRLWTAPDHTRIVFDLDRIVKHKLFSLKNPDRVVLDLMNVAMHADLFKRKKDFTDPVVRRIRTGTPRAGVTRVVFELVHAVRPRSFVLKKRDRKPDRLVVDLYKKESVADSVAVRDSRTFRDQRETKVIVIDAGHGGEDPGAIGKLGTHEKKVVLAVALKLARRINRAPGYRAHLTRKGDYYLPLRRRVKIAETFEPDLFISLHADAFHDRSARGASVYCLSERGKPSPDKLIRQLVQRENSADRIGGVDYSDYPQDVASLLMDLAQRKSIEFALTLGENLLGSLKKVTKIKFQNVKQAGFAVLKAPEIPSVLVEMAFLTNHHEERLLRRNTHQEALARAVFEGIQRYFSKIQKNG